MILAKEVGQQFWFNSRQQRIENRACRVFCVVGVFPRRVSHFISKWENVVVLIKRTAFSLNGFEVWSVRSVECVCRCVSLSAHRVSVNFFYFIQLLKKHKIIDL